MTDPIAAYLTTIRNGVKMKSRQVKIPASSIKEKISRVLKDEGFIDSFEVEKVEERSFLKVGLRYNQQGRSVITEIKRVSKPGCRVYKGKDEIPVYRNGIGVLILSTPKGVMSDRHARKENVGGEILCSIW
jgi:small subunit ribosomal protein S8